MLYAALKRRNRTRVFVSVFITPEVEPEKKPDSGSKGIITISVVSAPLQLRTVYLSSVAIRVTSLRSSSETKSASDFIIEN